MKKNTNSAMKKEQPRAKRAKAQRPVQRETKEVLAELVEKLRGRLELKATSASPAEAGQLNCVALRSQFDYGVAWRAVKGQDERGLPGDVGKKGEPPRLP